MFIIRRTLQLAACMCIATCAGAQSLDTLTVTITDLGGFVVSQASVLARDKTTGAEFYGLADNGGQAAITLPPGEYLVRVDAFGFAIPDSVDINVHGTSSVLVKLKPGPAIVCTLPCAGNFLVDVADQNGESIQRAGVFLTDPVTHEVRFAVTNDVGEATFRMFGPGQFEIAIRARGLASQTSNYHVLTGMGSSDRFVAILHTGKSLDSAQN